MSPVLWGNPVPSALCGWGVWLELWQCQLLQLGREVSEGDMGSTRRVLHPQSPRMSTRVGWGHFFMGENCVCVPGPRREQIIRLQGQVDKHYAGLKEAAEERRRRLENMSNLFQLKREVEELEQWIAERDEVASSPEMGQDLDQVMVRVMGWMWRCWQVA